MKKNHILVTPDPVGCPDPWITSESSHDGVKKRCYMSLTDENPLNSIQKQPWIMPKRFGFEWAKKGDTF